MRSYCFAAWLRLIFIVGALASIDSLAAPFQPATPVNVPTLRADSMLRAVDLQADHRFAW